MTAFSILSNLPELQGLPVSERIKVIRQWQREVNKPWSGYLRHVGFLLALCVPIIFAEEFFIPRSIHEPFRMIFLAFAICLAWIGGNVLHNRLVVLPRRDILRRLLEQRERTLQPGDTRSPFDVPQAS